MGTPAAGAMLLPSYFPAAADGTLLFPPLLGLSLEYTMRPTFSTIVQTGTDRSTTRLSLDPYPLWEYDLTFGHVSDSPADIAANPATNPASQTPYMQILGLFLACGARRDTFLLDLARFTRRTTDSTVTQGQIGIGDGARTAFQLVRSIGGFLDLIENPVAASVLVFTRPGGGGAITPVSFTLGSNGLVTLAAPPAAGAIVTANFNWLHRMRFTQDAEEFNALWFQMYTRDKLKLVQERNAAL